MPMYLVGMALHLLAFIPVRRVVISSVHSAFILHILETLPGGNLMKPSRLLYQGRKYKEIIPWFHYLQKIKTTTNYFFSRVRSRSFREARVVSRNKRW